MNAGMTASSQTATVPVIPENAPFTPAQRAWLNGFLAGMFSGRIAAAPEKRPTITIYFGTESGNAEGLAKRLSKTARKMNFEVEVKGLDRVSPGDLAEPAIALFVVSTFGDGDPPENARAFADALAQADAPSLQDLRYAICALGDTNYPKFCQFGKRLDERLAELGARRLYERADCDVDYEAPFECWQDGVLGVLVANSESSAASQAERSKSLSGHPSSSDVSPKPGRNGSGHASLAGTEEESGAEPGPSFAARIAEPRYSRNAPFLARLLENRLLTAAGSGKETRHFVLDLTGSGLMYEPGDALGVLPTNCPEAVETILRALNCDGEEAVPAGENRELPLRKALGDYYDINRISNELLEAVADRTGDPALKETLRDAAARQAYLLGREPIDLLEQFPAAQFDPLSFVQCLRKLQPRLYSIASSLKAHPEQVHLTVSIVRYQSYNRARRGVCSVFLADRARAAVPVFVQVSRSFRLPLNPEVPIIMVGPGTGVAPFRAFLQERSQKPGKNWLFFGEQHAATDFFYREELEAMLTAGHLTKLTTAFSRDQAEKIYVQRRMIEHGRELWEWLENGAHFYVCGDASRMAKDVDAALHQVIGTAGNLHPAAAAEYVRRLKTEKRYQRDVY